MRVKSYYIKLLIMVSVVFLITGCGTFETRHCYSPQNAPNWKSLGSRNYQFECNSGEVKVAPIVLSTTEIQEQEKPWIYMNFRSTKRIKNCDLSFVSLENKISGERVEPINAKTNVLDDDHFEKKTTYCYYYFDIGEEKSLKYNLCISDEVFGCKVDPIPYAYEEVTEWVPTQLQ